jgi:hypothetical protein
MPDYVSYVTYVVPLSCGGVSPAHDDYVVNDDAASSPSGSSWFNPELGMQACMLRLHRGHYMGLLRSTFKFAFLLVLLVFVFVGGWLIGRLGIGSVVEPASLTQAEREFVERMRNSTMVGTFTIAGREGRTPRPDRYDIENVEKVGEDLWRFNASMDCCGLNGRTIPIVVPMRWIGDTPVIMMTDTSLPGLGTFTVRVLFYGDRYSGTWEHAGEGGGHMSGRIEKQAPKTP